MKKFIFIILLHMFFSFAFCETPLEEFIEAWGNEYSKQEIEFFKELDHMWIPIEFLEWYKNKTLSEHTAQINTTFTITDLEVASLLFTKDVVILQFPYGIASSEICDVSKEADYYQVTLSRTDVAEDTTKKQFITDIWKTNQDTLSLSFQFNDAFLVITDNFQNKTQKYVKLSITDANHLVQALQTQKTDSLPYFDIITSSR